MSITLSVRAFLYALKVVSKVHVSNLKFANAILVGLPQTVQYNASATETATARTRKSPTFALSATTTPKYVYNINQLLQTFLGKTCYNICIYPCSPV